MSSPPLTGKTVLLAEDDAENLELLALSLQRLGARVLAASDAGQALRLARATTPDILVTDLSLGDGDGHALLARVRESTRADLPAIALTGHAGASVRAQAAESGFQKFLVKPTNLAELTAAVVSLTSPLAPPVAEALVHGYNVRGLLALLNSDTRHRFTSVFRFDDSGRLSSVWTFDRHKAASDDFPLDVGIECSYCVYVRETGRPFVIEDSHTDARVAHHPKRASLRSYCGVPIWRDDGSMYGSLCHFDPDPQRVDPATVDKLQAAAALLTRLFSENLPGL